MDPYRPATHSTPNKVLRTKSEILTKTWGTDDHSRVFSLAFQCESAPDPPIEMWTKLKLPYQVPSCPPLPSYEQLMKAFDQHKISSSNGNNNVCKIGNAVIKCSDSPTILEEAETLLFLAEKRPLLKIPTVWAIWTLETDDKRKCYCLMTNFIDGILLSDSRKCYLPDLPIRVQDIILTKISEQITYLRNLPSEGYYGRAYQQGWLDPAPGIRTYPSPGTEGFKAICGPYHTYTEFTSTVHEAYEVNKAFGGLENEFRPDYVETACEMLSIFPEWKPNQPTFTWVDPKLQNMIARPIGGDEKKEDGQDNEDWEVFLLDWECAGWYPAWVQSLQFARRCGAIVQKPAPVGHSGILPYRNKEIQEQTRKVFDPDCDEERLAIALKHDWWFY